MSREPTVLVTGATGQIGGLTVRHLLAAGRSRVRLLVRDPARLRPETRALCEVIHADLAIPASLARAAEGVDAALIVTPAAPALPELEGHIADALAAGANAPRVVKIAGLATAPDSKVDSGRWHAASERHIRSLGLPHVFVRPPFLMQNIARQLPDALRTGVLAAAAADARIAMIDASDVAAVAAALLDGARAPAAELTLTGPEALSYADVAATISDVSGRPVRYQPISPADLDAALARRGEPDWHRQLLLQFNRAFRDGLAAAVTDAVAQVLGQPPLALRSFLRGWRAPA